MIDFNFGLDSWAFRHDGALTCSGQTGQSISPSIFIGERKYLSPVWVIPEPITAIFFGTGVVGVLGYVARRKMQKG